MNLIAHVEIPVRDLDRAMEFYRELLQIEFTEIKQIHNSRMAFFPFEPGKDGASGSLCQGDAYVPTYDGGIIYFGVEDIDAALARAVQLGSEILFEKVALPTGGFVAEISDTQGNRIALQTVF